MKNLKNIINICLYILVGYIIQSLISGTFSISEMSHSDRLLILMYAFFVYLFIDEDE